MNDKIPVNDNMPEDLKAAINYLNSKNISLDDKLDDEDEDIVLASEDEFSGEDDEIDESVSDNSVGGNADSSDIDFGDDADLSQLDDVF